MNVLDIAALAALAHAHKMPLVVDNTSLRLTCAAPSSTARHCPHSATKFIGGHGTSIAGVILDIGHFDGPRTIPALLAAPALSQHPLLRDLRPLRLPHEGARGRPPRVGAALSPINSFLFIQGLETLKLRMDRHSPTPWKSPNTSKTNPTSPGYLSRPAQRPDITRSPKRYLPRGARRVLAFGTQGGSQAGRRFIQSLQLFSHLAKCRRCQEPGDSSGFDHAPAAHGGRTPRGRHLRRPHPPFGRIRRDRRHLMGSESGAGGQPVSHCAISFAEEFQDGVGGNSPVNRSAFATTPHDRRRR